MTFSKAGPTANLKCPLNYGGLKKKTSLLVIFPPQAQLFRMSSLKPTHNASLNLQLVIKKKRLPIRKKPLHNQPYVNKQDYPGLEKTKQKNEQGL